MTAYAIAKTKWILKLAPQLTGKAQQAYAALPILILIDCIHIKIHTYAKRQVVSRCVRVLTNCLNMEGMKHTKG